MAELEAKTKPARYPMGTIKQARNTLARLTRDLLNGKIDREKYRAACYGLSVLCGLFRLETPVLQDVKVPHDIIKRIDELMMEPQERDKRIEELMIKGGYVPEQTLPEATKVRNPHFGTSIGADGKTKTAESESQSPETEPAEVVKIEGTGMAWKPCGIGVKNR